MASRTSPIWRFFGGLGVLVVAATVLYFLAAGVSWLLTGDFGARNVFERRAGLAEGGYADRPLRPALTRSLPRLVIRYRSTNQDKPEPRNDPFG